MDYYIKIDGGIGRCIVSTGAVLEFQRRQKELGNTVSVVSSMTLPFDGIGIDRVYPIATPYLYEDKIIHGEYIEPEPYNSSRFYRDNLHISQVFNLILNDSDEYLPPKMVLMPNEEVFAKQFIDGTKKKDNKKVLLLQPYAATGGIPVPDESFRTFTDDSINEIIEAFKKNYTILLVRSPNQATWSDTSPLMEQDIRRVIATIPYVDGAICCDSFLHHAIAALGNPIPTVVLWGGTSEKNFGYKEQTNLRKKNIGLVEPNRIPHAHNYYVTKNKGSNDFTGMVDKIKEVISGTTSDNSSGQQSPKGSRRSKKKGTKSNGNGCGDCSKVLEKAVD